MSDGKRLVLQYPFRPEPRYGYGKPPHTGLYEIIDKRRRKYRRILEAFLELSDGLLRIPREHPESTEEPVWINPWISGLDTVALYSFLCLRDPERYVEVGSGWSTKIARRAIRDQRLRTKITSIDPHPRTEIDAICDEVLRSPLEETDLALFDKVTDGDVVFVDASHRCFMNSDATVAFLDVVPRLRDGVLFGIHDIFLPDDYPPEWVNRFYSEQYLLAAYVLAEGPLFEIALPAAFASNDPELAGILDPLWNNEKLDGVQRFGGSFWIETTGRDGGRGHDPVPGTPPK
jgi:hypothetical protein